MVQNRPILDIISHMILIFGVLIVALPIWITFVAATHDPIRMTQAPIPLLPGTYFWENFVTTLFLELLILKLEEELQKHAFSNNPYQVI